MKVRFAPSPTGVLHIGGARTALYNWLLARGQGGEFVLRIEDTDRERSTPENVEQILDAMRWLELDFDEGPISQAERAPAHTAAIDKLLADGHAYEDDGAVRLRVPDEGETVVHDQIRGEIATPNQAIQDFVIRALRRQRALQPRRRGGRSRHGHHARGPRRGPHLEHPAAGDDPARARRGAARLRPPAAAARAGRQEALKAPRRRLGSGAARFRLPPRGRAQLHRAARVGLRRVDHVLHDRGADRALRPVARLEEPGGLRRAEAALDERALPARAARRGPEAAGSSS